MHIKNKCALCVLTKSCVIISSSLLVWFLNKMKSLINHQSQSVSVVTDGE